MIFALKTENLAVGYRHRSQTRPVLGNLNLSVAPGELVALIGANSIGKSTLLRTLARMQPTLAGTIEI
ncbi:MAG: ATP-binding cassette domain-containing protein, partial [Hyphomicrobiales bacterium]